MCDALCNGFQGLITAQYSRSGRLQEDGEVAAITHTRLQVLLLQCNVYACMCVRAAHTSIG
jgi:hypothetical protein